MTVENVSELLRSENWRSDDGIHLYIFVHGLAGNSYDLRILKDYLAYHFRANEFLLCKSLEGSTLQSMEELGHNIALEILKYLEVTQLDVTRIRYEIHL